MQWDRVDVIKFIDLLRTREILWYPRHEHRFNRTFKDAAWREISQVMNCSIADLRKKLENLLAQLRREKGKMKKARAENPDEAYVSTWYAFEHLTFLRERHKRRSRVKIKESQEDETSSTSTEQSEDEQFENAESENADSLKVELQPSEDPPENFEYVHTSMDLDDTPISQNNVVQSIFKQPSSKRKKINDTEMHSPTTARMSEVPVRDFASTTPDDSETYANFIASKFRTYSQHTKNALQYEISKLLYKADNGCFELYKPSFASSSRQSVKPVQSTHQSPSQTESRCQRTSYLVIDESGNKLDLIDVSPSNEEDATQN